MTGLGSSLTPPPRPGNAAAAPVRAPAHRAFTLIELILVMALMVTVLGLLAPSLSRFFRGRTLDSEARRMVSLTRYGQARAVSEGIPMLMWIDPVRQAYGLEAEYSYTANDDKAVDYALDRDLGVEAQFARRRPAEGGMVRQDRRFGASVVQIRFQPDGFIGEQSPDLLRLTRQPRSGEMRQDDEAESIWIARSRNGLNYEIATNHWLVQSR